MAELIKKHFLEAKKVLDEFIDNEQNFHLIEQAGNMMVDAVKADSKIISCGNGGSMTDAMHFAEELTGRFRETRPAIPAIAISDPSHITCAANDFGFNSIFSRFVKAIGKKGDVLLAISTSGNSENIINAANTAKIKSIKVIGLTGKNGGKLSELCDIEIRTPYSEYSDRVQEIHIKIIHSLIHYIETKLFPKPIQ